VDTRKIDRGGRAGALVMALLVTFLAGPAAAQRPDARAMSCDQARALVASRGAVVLTTGRHTYDRYVATAAYCGHFEILKRAYVTTGDGLRCRVGYVCALPYPKFRS
jgi:hypothetical protein